MTTAYCGLPFAWPPAEQDVDNRIDERLGVRFIGKAWLQPDGTWRALADFHGALCLVQVTLRFPADAEPAR